MTITKAILCLQDGRTFLGESFGAQGETTGEVVFNTSLSGYQEVITDPSYKGQIVTMTYPLIGNYGVNEEDSESGKPQVEGLVVRELCPLPSNWRSQKTLDAYLKDYGILGIQGIDTRALTKHIRDAGAQLGIISTVDFDPKSLREKLEKAPQYVGRDLVKEVTCLQPFDWKEGTWTFPESDKKPSKSKGDRFNVIVYDYGVKRNILRHLVDEGCDVTVVPASFPAEEVLGLRTQGVCLSNGPGDPAALPYVIDNVRKLIGKLPIMGICMGHQILGLALGGKTFKLKFGHRGGNQPVKDLATGKVAITAQNHGFCVDFESLDTKEVFLTHINLNDQTLEGFQHKQLPLFSVQYHPEAAPGPHDASYLFKQFCELMKHAQAN
jgi:carbamoyl-phosphate synthase small subunit